MKAIRLKIRLKKQAEKELIQMVNQGDTGDLIIAHVKKITDFRDVIGRDKEK